MNSGDLLKLKQDGYVVIKGVLTNDEIKKGCDLFMEYYQSLPQPISAVHGIIKHYRIGHTRFSWFVRTRDRVVDIWRQIWNTSDLITSFDGACYFGKPDRPKKESFWLHTDQDLRDSSFKCIQGFVSFTTNQSASLQIVPRSHNHHHLLKLIPDLSSKKGNFIKLSPLDWIKLQEATGLAEPITVSVSAGDMVLWDSRCLHQNTNGDESRLVQYVSMMPRELANQTQLRKRLNYFEERRTTSHWATPIRVNSNQPQTFGDNSKLIDYSKLPPEDLSEFIDLIYDLV